VNYFLRVLEQTGVQLLLFMGPALALAILMQLTTQSVEKSAYAIWGSKLYLAIFGWFGVIIHELGHALFCLIFMHKIDDIKLFSPDQSQGTLGYVKHSYNRANFYQRCGNFFIGIGPILLGSLVIFVSAKLLMGSISMFRPEVQSIDPIDSLMIAFRSAFDYLTSLLNVDALTRWQTYLFVYISFSVGSNITLSRADIKGAMSGLISLISVIFLVNLATLNFANLGNNLYISLSPYYHLFYAMMIFVILINICFKLVLIPFTK